MIIEQINSVVSLKHLWLFLLSAATSVALIIACHRIPRLSGSSLNARAVQAMHYNITPRVGGVAIFLGLVLAIPFSATDVAANYSKLLLGASVLFSGTLMEDLGFGVSAKRRLLLTVFSSLIVIFLLDTWLPRVGIPVVDDFMGIWFVGIPLTVLVTAGAANALNLIDGVHGLSSVASLTTATAMGVICYETSYLEMLELTTLLSATVLGFFALNFPFGKIFLGDAGAYTIGFLLAWFAIAILINLPDVTPWALLLTFFWPVADTCLAIYRRLRKGTSAASADRLHFHQLVLRGMEIKIFGKKRRRLSNPLTTAILLPMIVAPAVVSTYVWNQPTVAFLSVCCFFAVFFVSSEILFRVITTR